MMHSPDIHFTVPGKPQPKARPCATSANGRAHVYTPARTRAYEAIVRTIAQGALDGRSPLEGPIDVAIQIRLAPRASATKSLRERMLAGDVAPTRRPDLDNLVKSIVDGCNGVAFRDDAQITRLSATKRYHDAAGVDVTITEIRDGCPDAKT